MSYGAVQFFPNNNGATQQAVGAGNMCKPITGLYRLAVAKSV